MTHDPLCPQQRCDYNETADADCMGYEDCTHRCQCDLISKVRADQDMVAYAKHLALDYEHTREAWEAGYKEGKAAASAT